MCWLCGFKSQMLSVSTFLCLFVNTFVFVCFVLAALHQHCYVCEHLAVRVYHLLRRTQVLRRVTNLREKFLVNQVFPGETGGMRAVATLFPATITRPSQTAPTSLSPSGWIFCILCVFVFFALYLVFQLQTRPLGGVFFSVCNNILFSTTDDKIMIILLANFINPEHRFDLDGTKHFFLLAFTGLYILKFSFVCRLFSNQRQEVFKASFGVLCLSFVERLKILSELLRVPAAFWHLNCSDVICFSFVDCFIICLFFCCSLFHHL